jgi:large subunit ribosomal protein L1
MSKKSKLYRAKSEMIEDRYYAINEALELLKSLPAAKFDETVEVAFKLGIDPRQSDQNVRGALPLPKGTGKSVIVTVIADGDAAEQAKAAGADFVGSEEIIDRIKGGWLEFDVLIATPSLMPKVRPLGRALGPRGLMPNPKIGTVTDNVAGAVKEAKGGRVEYRADRGACVHVPVGKVSFTADDLAENIESVLVAVNRAKPASAKGVYMQSFTITSTMSPAIKVDLKEIARVIS